MASQVIAFKNDGAVGLLLGVFILLQNICIITSILLLVSDLLALSPMLILVAVGFVVLNICWFCSTEHMLVLRFADPSLDQDSIANH